MSLDAGSSPNASAVVVPNLLELCKEAAANAERLLASAAAAVRARVTENGALNADLIEREQHACHGLAWLATYAEAIKQMAAYAERLTADGRFGEMEALLTQIGVGEYAAQVLGGIPMNQSEMVRLRDLDLTSGDSHGFASAGVLALIKANSPAARARLVELIKLPKARAISAKAASTRRSKPCAARCAASSRRK